MTRRRDLILGGACVAAGAASFGLTPRRRVSLLGADKLDAIVPRSFGDWTSTDMDDEVAPKEAGSLASRLYGQTVGRLYANRRTGAEVMMLLAYGDTQSNDLQVHRPEVCYPAFGYEILNSAAAAIALSPHAIVPVRRLSVRRQGRIEQIVYWTRLGEFLPTSIRDQRMDRLRNALHGIVADGLLARFSRQAVSLEDPATSLDPFIAELIGAMAREKRKALLGSSLGGELSGLGQKPGREGG